MSDLRYHIVNTRTGRVIAAFLLATDAQKYIDTLHAREGVHGPMYRLDDMEQVDGRWVTPEVPT